MRPPPSRGRLGLSLPVSLPHPLPRCPTRTRAARAARPPEDALPASGVPPGAGTSARPHGVRDAEEPLRRLPPLLDANPRVQCRDGLRRPSLLARLSWRGRAVIVRQWGTRSSAARRSSPALRHSSTVARRRRRAPLPSRARRGSASRRSGFAVSSSLASEVGAFSPAGPPRRSGASHWRASVISSTAPWTRCCPRSRRRDGARSKSRCSWRRRRIRSLLARSASLSATRSSCSPPISRCSLPSTTCNGSTPRRPTPWPSPCGASLCRCASCLPGASGRPATAGSNRLCPHRALSAWTSAP